MFGWSPLNVAVTATSAAILPLLLIPSMRRLALLSGMGFLSTLLVTAAVAAAAAVDPHRTAIPQQASS